MGDKYIRNIYVFRLKKNKKTKSKIVTKKPLNEI